jgi:hypothetical protein
VGLEYVVVIGVFGWEVFVKKTKEPPLSREKKSPLKRGEKF